MLEPIEALLPSVAYYVISGVLVLGVLIGISLMSRASTARFGNALSAICTVIAILVTMYNFRILSSAVIWISIAVGTVLALIFAAKVKMIQMPQVVALLNGFGGLSSALVAILSYTQARDLPFTDSEYLFTAYVSEIALVIGFVTFTGSLVAAGKLHKVLPQKPVVLRGHTALNALFIIVTVIAVIIRAPIWITSLLAAMFGILFAIRVGGADMPITISLLNSLSGVAGGIAGIAVNDLMLVAIGGIVGASGLLLTRIMCKAMNRKLSGILLGSRVKKPAGESTDASEKPAEEEAPAEEKTTLTPGEIISAAQKVIIVPGYGMALAQAQSKVKALFDKLESKGKSVKFAIHPVAGRMPGHMNVLLAEADVPYDKLFEMDEINDEFADTDVVIIVGASDVVNPAANTAEGTPIYGMPVLKAGDAKYVIVCNFDDKPGYAGVPNTLYKKSNTIMLLGDANETVPKITESF